MNNAMRTMVTFQSDMFNKTEERDYFVNPDCFGDDVCRFIISKLKTAGVECDDSPDQEDWGWFFYFHANGKQYRFCCGLRRNWPEEEPWDEAWICFVDWHDSGFLSAFGIGKKEIAIEALQQIHQALSSTQGISAIRWHEAKEFNKGNEDLGMPTPE
jgi:hypothetical protein